MVKDGTLPEITKIGDEAFVANEYIEEVILPDSVTSIGTAAFAGCQALKSVTANKVSSVFNAAFMACPMLESFKSDELRFLGDEVFAMCSSLTEFSGKKLTSVPRAAFYMTAVTNDCFDFDKITSYGELSFSCAGLTGTLDVSKGKMFGANAFEYTAIEEFIYPEEYPFLPASILSGCAELKKISAPGVTIIDSNALALGSGESAIESDIDYSKVENVGERAFNGFRFSKPVSFDSLIPNQNTHSFDGALGECISLPTVTKVYGNIESTVDVLRLDNVEEIVENAFLSANAVIVGNKLKVIEKGAFITSGELFTEIRDKDIAEMCAKNDIRYTSMPAVYMESDFRTLPKNDYAEYTAICVGEGTYGKWFLVDDDGKETELPMDFATPNTLETGVKNFVYKQYDKNDKLVSERELNVNVFDVEIPVLKENEGIFLDFINTPYTNKYYQTINAEFVPETSGVYRFTCCNYMVNISNEDGHVASGSPTESIDGVLLPYTFEAELEKGVTYNLLFNLAVSELQFNPSLKYYFSAVPADSNKTLISALDTDVSWSSFDGNLPYRPEIMVYGADGEALQEDVDYKVTFDEEVHFGSNHYVIEGIGDYFGIAVDETTELYPYAQLDTPIEYKNSNPIVFIPEESGLYKVVSKPTDEYINAYKEIGYYPNSKVYKSEVNVFHRIPTDIEGVFDFVELTPYSINGKRGMVAHNNENSVSYVTLKAGDMYLLDSLYDQVITITQGSTINDCVFDCQLNYTFDGKPVTPVITATDLLGNELKEGKDFRVTCWNNDKPGMMFAYVEGIGDYVGAKSMCMYISENGEELLSKHNGFTVYNVNLNENFKTYPDIYGYLALDESVVVSLEGIDSKNTPDIAFMDPDSRSGGYILNYNMPSMTLYEGEYFIQGHFAENFYDRFYETDGFEAVLNADDNKKFIGNCSFEAEAVEYTGEPELPALKIYDGDTLLEQGVDYWVTFKEEDFAPGVHSLIIIGSGRYTDTTVTDYYIKAPEDTKKEKLTTGYNTIDLSACKDNVAVFEWTPEENFYYVSVSSLRNVNVSIIDDEFGIVNYFNVSLKTPMAFYAEAGRTYNIYIEDNSDDKFDLLLCTEGFIGDHLEKYNNIVAYGSGPIDPAPVFTDGDYTLVEGKDYKLVSNGFVDDIGRLEYVYRGIGKYFGDIVLPVFVYPETLPEDIDFIEAGVSMPILIGDQAASGSKSFYKFTSPYEGTTKYSIDLNTIFGTKAAAATVFAYDSNGEIIGGNETVSTFTLEKGETIYFIATLPYVFNYAAQMYDQFATFAINVSSTPDHILGDVDGDGKVDATDASFVLNEYALSSTNQPTSLTPEQKLAANVNGDYFIDATDASKILAYYALCSTNTTGTPPSWDMV